jgi:hypothetical protein
VLPALHTVLAKLGLAQAGDPQSLAAPALAKLVADSLRAALGSGGQLAGHLSGAEQEAVAQFSEVLDGYIAQVMRAASCGAFDWRQNSRRGLCPRHDTRT